MNAGGEEAERLLFVPRFKGFSTLLSAVMNLRIRNLWHCLLTELSQTWLTRTQVTYDLLNSADYGVTTPGWCSLLWLMWLEVRVQATKLKVFLAGSDTLSTSLALN